MVDISHIKKIAVIGPIANDYRVMLGNYHGTSDNIITPYMGIRDKMEQSGTEVSYAPGCQVTTGVPLLHKIDKSYIYADPEGERHGLTARYFNNRDFKGVAVLERVDENIDFFWYDKTPVSGKMADEFSVIWEGYLKAPISGIYEVGINACNNVRFYFEDSLRFSIGHPHHPSQKTITVELAEGKLYPVNERLVWLIPLSYER